MSNIDDYDNEEEESFFTRFKAPIIIGVIVVACTGGYFVWKGQGPKEEKKKAPKTSMIVISTPPPPPPPPPPPKEPEPEPEQEAPKEPMLAQEQVLEPEPEPEAAPEPPAETMSTSNVGDGPPNNFGLAAGNGGGGRIGGSGTGTGSGRGGSKYGWYAGQVQTTMSSALRKNSQTRNAVFTTELRIWADSSGRVTRARASDAAVQKALQDEINAGLQLPKPPPADMPMPIVMRVSGKRPN